MTVQPIQQSDVFDYLENGKDVIAIDFGFSEKYKDLTLYNCQQRKVAEISNLLTDEGNLFFLVEDETTGG